MDSRQLKQYWCLTKKVDEVLISNHCSFFFRLSFSIAFSDCFIITLKPWGERLNKPSLKPFHVCFSSPHSNFLSIKIQLLISPLTWLRKSTFHFANYCALRACPYAVHLKPKDQEGKLQTTPGKMESNEEKQNVQDRMCLGREMRSRRKLQIYIHNLMYISIIMHLEYIIYQHWECIIHMQCVCRYLHLEYIVWTVL